jgi:hypothetical protein
MWPWRGGYGMLMYFGNMDALAALCIHRRMKALALAARSGAKETFPN